MDKNEVLKILQIERQCIARDCDRNCRECDLVQERDHLLSVYDEAISIIEQVKTGKWIEKSMEDAVPFRIIQCSECGWGPAVNNRVPLEVWACNKNFCEKCGARMEKMPLQMKRWGNEQ